MPIGLERRGSMVMTMTAVRANHEHNMEETMNSADASAEAVHKARNAQQAIELAREAQIHEAIAKTAENTKAALLEGLKEVFGDGDDKDPNQMRILVRRIPILCTNIETMHQDIAEIKDGNKWLVRIVVGAVVLAVIKLVLIP